MSDKYKAPIYGTPFTMQLLESLLADNDIVLKNKKYSKIISDWKKSSFLGSEVKVKTLGKKYSGTAFDVDKDCFLILKDKKH